MNAPHFHRLIKRYEGPLAVTHACPFCKFSTTRRKGGGGRGQGFREGNKARGLIIQHMKEQHADKIQES